MALICFISSIVAVPFVNIAEQIIWNNLLDFDPRWPASSSVMISSASHFQDSFMPTAQSSGRNICMLLVVMLFLSFQKNGYGHLKRMAIALKLFFYLAASCFFHASIFSFSLRSKALTACDMLHSPAFSNSRARANCESVSDCPKFFISYLLYCIHSISPCIQNVKSKSELVEPLPV